MTLGQHTNSMNAVDRLTVTAGQQDTVGHPFHLLVKCSETKRSITVLSVVEDTSWCHMVEAGELRSDSAKTEERTDEVSLKLLSADHR